jgi:hypothetical protein
MKELIPRLVNNAQLTKEQIDIILKDNPRRLLQWWTPPPKPTKPVRYMECSLCKRLFEPVLGEYYTKYTFTYCGAKCLREHGKMKFGPI